MARPQETVSILGKDSWGTAGAPLGHRWGTAGAPLSNLQLVPGRDNIGDIGL